MIERTAQSYARCEHETDGERDCAIISNLSFVPSIAKTLCVFHKREQQRASGERPALTQGQQVCPHCNEVFDIRGAAGRRARSHARKAAIFAFDRHVATCLTRQAVLRAQSTTNSE